MAKLSVYILTRDRPHYVMQAIASLLQALSSEMTLIISDNSVRNDTKGNLEGMTQFKYIRRTPQLTAVEHVAAVIDECKTPYIIIFHDDDVALPNFLSEMLETISTRENIVAAACNAQIIYGEEVSERLMMGWLREPILITKKADILAPYMRFSAIEPPPFPSYIYKTEALRTVGALDTCGKYSDVCILSELLDHGHIYWDSRCLMHYRFHDENDGKIQSLRDKLRLLRYVKSVSVFASGSPEIRDYRLRLHLQALLSGSRLFKKKFLGRSNKIIGCFLAQTICNPSLIYRIFVNFSSRRFGLRRKTNLCI